MLNDRFESVQCDIYDEKLSESGSLIINERIKTIEKINTNLNYFYSKIRGDGFSELEKIDVVYESTVDRCNSRKSVGKNVFYTQLKQCLEKDCRAGFTSCGPHRDNIRFLYNDRDARIFCSQGQCRSIVLAFKLSISILLEELCQEKIMFLIDDTVSELDTVRINNFFPLIEKRGQIFIAIPQGTFSFFNSFTKIAIV